jgi:hypothetical protein
MPRERLRNDAARARGEPAAVSDGGGGIGTGGPRQLVWVLLRTGLRGGGRGTGSVSKYLVPSKSRFPFPFMME